jgi:hypothetical protein
MSDIDITPDDGTDDIPTEPRGFVEGERVSHVAYQDRLGTVVWGDWRGVRVDWDMVYGETIEASTALRHDAPMPDPAYALAKGLRYRRQRDAALTDLARVAGLETEYAIKFGEQGRKLEDAREEMTLAYARQAKLLTETTEKLTATTDRLVAALDAIGRINEATEEHGDDAPIHTVKIVRGILAERFGEPVVDTPTEGVGE